MFALAYYRWAQELWAREIDEDFPILHAIRGEDPLVTFDAFKGLTHEEILRTGLLLVRRGHREAVRVLGEGLSPAEAEEVRLFEERRRAAALRFYAWDWMEADRALNRSVLKQHVRRAVEPILGTDRHASGREWEYCTTVGPWKILTNLEFGGSGCMSYFHDIVVPPDETRCFAQNLSPPECLGVAQAKWSGLSEADIPAAAEGLAYLCRIFLEAVPRLLPK